MKQGKFEAGRRDTAEGERPRRRIDWLLILVPVLILGALAAILFLTLGSGGLREGEETIGFSKEETLEQYRNLSYTIEGGNMELTLLPADPEAQDDPIVLTIPASLSRVRVDLNGLTTDLEEGVGKVGRNRYVTNPGRYLSLDQKILRELAEQTERRYSQVFMESFAVLITIPTGDSEVLVLSVNAGQRGVEISAQAICDALMDAYLAGDLHPTLTYETKEPQPLNAVEIRKSCTTEPVDATLDMTTFEIAEEVPGYGIDLADLEAVLSEAEDGIAYHITLRELPAAVTAEALEASLYADVLAEAHTPHSSVKDRTNNLKLACQEIDGTIVMPGEVFSFNETVGQRTEAKGYREATAYVGGASVPEIGGGVCQVASSIYYAVLQADLRTVERRSHTYLVTYVPEGMDAAIYWGSIDYKFENTSPTPIKIEASVSDGYVHIILRGREWKNYTVELGSDTLETIPYETVERIITDGSYENGKTIVTPYTGYKISTWKKLKDLDGNLIEKVHIATSSYRKRDKVVAVVPPTPKPTESSSPSG